MSAQPLPAPAFHLIRTWHDYVWWCWQHRPCWICSQDGEQHFGWCPHRERSAESILEFELITRRQG